MLGKVLSTLGQSDPLPTPINIDPASFMFQGNMPLGFGPQPAGTRPLMMNSFNRQRDDNGRP